MLSTFTVFLFIVRADKIHLTVAFSILAFSPSLMPMSTGLMILIVNERTSILISTTSFIKGIRTQLVIALKTFQIY